MSFQAMAAATTVRGISPTAKFVLIMISNYADEDFCAFPSLKRLSEDTGFSTRTITNAITDLEKAGYLVREARARPNGSQTSSTLRVRIGGGEALHEPAARLETGDRGGLEAPSSPEPVRINQGIDIDASASDADLFCESIPMVRPTDGGFEAWWRGYPRKVSKGDAKKAYDRARKRIGKGAEQILIDGAQRLAAEFSHDTDKTFIPHPATWLNGDGWNDEPGARRPKGGGMASRSANGGGSGRGASDFASIYAERYGDGGNEADVSGDGEALQGSFRVVGGGA